MLPVGAQQVAVIGDLGQALLFNYRGNCYAVLPGHVTRRSSISLVSASPVFHGTGTIHFRTDKATDLAVAYIEGPVTKYCNINWRELPRDLSRVLENGKEGYIKRIYENGTLERLPVSIPDFGHYTITASLKEKTSRTFAGKGMSGSILYIGNIPVGIIQNAASESRISAYRMDEVVLRLKRWMEGAADDTAEASKSLKIKQAITGTGKGITFRIGFWNTASIHPDLNVQNLEKGPNAPPYVAPWTGAPVKLVIELASGKAQTINALTFIAKTDDKRLTVPKSVRIRADASQGTSRSWRPIYSPEMPPNGYLKVSTGGTYARRFEILVDKVWDAKKAVRLDRVIVE